ncbi:MAG: NAD(P)/FAD-dependent oxidoreductase [Christensenellaceae bacterium]|nr:NAD(P)/FAD-dependent oxidoreductase [Christensenellaceae bacterium]
MFDVIIIGLGVIGASVARELSRFRLNILGIEAEEDYACGASSANSGIVHAGYDAKPGTLKAKFNVLGNKLFKKWADELHFPYINNGSLVLCHSKEDIPRLEALYEQGIRNGVDGMEILMREELIKLEPNLSESVVAALRLKTGGICCPYEFTFACAENAQKNGALFRLGERVLSVKKDDEIFIVKTDKAEYKAKLIINAAGLYSDEINNMLSEKKMRIIPRKGEYLLMDDKAGAFFTHTIFDLPSALGKGILISPTVDGNLFIGPTAVEIGSKTDVSVSQEAYDVLISGARKSWSAVPENRFITSFSGLRAHPEGGDFVIGEAEDCKGLINAAGIESPGLTSSPAIAEYIAALVKEKTGAEEKEDFDPIRLPIEKFRLMTDEEKKAAIERDPAFGHIVCRCNIVSEAEIKEAIRRGGKTMDGVKRRVRAGMGKCQGGFCTPEIAKLISKTAGIPMEEVTKHGKGSKMLVGSIRGGEV